MPSNPAYSSPTYNAAPITGDRLAVLAPNAVRQLWKKGVDTFEQTNDFFAEFEGQGPNSLIQTVTDTSRGAGQKITFTVKSGLYHEAHMGDELFNDSRHFEELQLGSNDLTVDWFRHAVRYTERGEEKMGMRGELMDGVPEDLGQWAGRLKTEKMFMLYREQTPGENKIPLTTALNWDAIVTNSQMMKRWGAAPAMVGRDPRGKPVRNYCVVACTDALTSLELDSGYRDILKTTNDAQGSKYLFSGGYTPVRGHVIKEYEAIEHDGYGAIGSPLDPKARLGQALTIATNSYTAVQYIYGGGSDYDANNIFVKPMKYFDQFAYKVQAGVTLSPTAGSFYVAIINSPSATTDPGKYGFYKCNANDGVKLTIESALVDGTTVVAHAAGTGPSLVTTLGSVAWNSAKHSNTHAVDSLVVAVGSDAVAEFSSLILGAASARRGYGKMRNGRAVQEHEGGFVRDVYFKTVFGQAVRTNRKNRAPGVLVLKHKGVVAGTPLPTP